MLRPRIEWLGMSIEGPGLYQDDTGVDVRAEFRDLVGEGVSEEDATQRLLSGWSEVLSDEDVFCAFHLALADTQWRLGRLVPTIRDVSLGLIATGRDLRRWEYSPPFHRKRGIILEELGRRLRSQPPPVRTVRKQSVFVTKLAAGDLVQYEAAEGDSFLLGVVGVDASSGQAFAVVRLVEWVGDLNTLILEDLPIVSNLMPFALMPYRGADMPTRQSKTLTRSWRVPVSARHDSTVGCSIVSWGVNLDWQLRKPRQV